jgi:Tfp pilus assembly protein PilF
VGIKEFFQTIVWGATLQIAATRIVIAAILWPILFIIFWDVKVAQFFELVFGYMLLFSIFIAIAIPAIGLSRANVPFIGLVAIPAWLVVVADPFVKLLHTIRPNLVPIDEFKLINPPVLAIFQTNDPNDPIEMNDDQTTDLNDETAQIIYEDGLRIFEEGEKREGLLQMVEAIKVDPHHIDANLFVSNGFYQADPVENAASIFLMINNVLEVEPDNEKAQRLKSATHFAIGKHAWDIEDWAKATDSFVDAYSIDPTFEHLSGALAHCAENGGFMLKAISAFEARLNKEPSDAEARQLAGRSYMKLALSQDALDNASMTKEEALKLGAGHLMHIIQHDPDNVDANYWLATFYGMTGQDDKLMKIVGILRPISPEKAADIEGLLS